MRIAKVVCFAALVCAAGALAALSGLACDTTIHEEGDVTATCLEAARHSDYDWISENVFAIHCSLAIACHATNRPAADLNLTTGRAHNDLVGVAAISVPDWIRVVPGDPDHSYLMVKMGVVRGPLGDGGLMPQGSGGRLLCHQKLDAVRRWIAAGALTGTPDAAIDAGVDAAGAD